MTYSVALEPLQKQLTIPINKAALQQKLDSALALIMQKLDATILDLGDKFPGEACKDGVWPHVENCAWTAAFWPGRLWLAWEMTNEDRYREAAERCLPAFRFRLAHAIRTNTHDLGFLYTLSCVSAWKLTGNETARQLALEAADKLMERYLPDAGILQAWGTLDDPEQKGRIIIDCNMNLPLLYWASEQTGDRRYAEAAIAHVAQAATHLVRADASTFHTYFFDAETGKARFGNTHQGYSDDSCWARGQAWGIYGFLLTWRYTGDSSMVELSRRLAHYFLNRLPEDDVCHWDLDLCHTDAVRDSSAAAITVCGLLELVNGLPVLDPNREIYENWALQIMASLTEHYLSTAEERCEGILKHGVYHMHDGIGVDECTSWGDYFYMEAMIRLQKSWMPYW